MEKDNAYATRNKERLFDRVTLLKRFLSKALQNASSSIHALWDVAASSVGNGGNSRLLLLLLLPLHLVKLHLLGLQLLRLHNTVMTASPNTLLHRRHSPHRLCWGQRRNGNLNCNWRHARLLVLMLACNDGRRIGSWSLCRPHWVWLRCLRWLLRLLVVLHLPWVIWRRRETLVRI